MFEQNKLFPNENCKTKAMAIGSDGYWCLTINPIACPYLKHFGRSSFLCNHPKKIDFSKP
jgi:hypothetical protein